MSQLEKPTLTKESPLTKFSIDELPKEIIWDTLDLYKWNGYWYRPHHLQATMCFRSQFEPRDDDIILASSMKTGTTWLKALSLAMLHSNVNKDDDPLAKNHPAFYVQTLEIQVYTSNPLPDLSTMKSPRIFHTHLPYSALPDSIKNSGCKIVYITRNPKDTLLSMWHFFNRLRKPEDEKYPLEEVFKYFCNGVSHFGPFLDHVLEYWKESMKLKDKILFLKYEDIKKNPKHELKRLASFVGKEFVSDDEVDDVLWRCSLDRLKNLEVNKSGVDHWVSMPNSAYFRTGLVGGWKTGLTLEMVKRIDEITEMKLEGSGLDFEI